MGHRAGANRPQPRLRNADHAARFIGPALAVITLAAFAGVWRNDFVNFDDDAYVTANPHVYTGLSAANSWWALTTWDVANWHPLTWISLQLDAQLYGLASAGYHLTNLLLHVANSVLLFSVLWVMTGAPWRSGGVAALFAVHPLHVESVAWVAERKDVLSTLFWILTLWAYAGYAARPGLARYLLVVLAFSLGLMAKPMLVTLPCVLLLLDYWPLKRVQAIGQEDSPGRFVPRQLSALVLEKLPLFVLTGASIWVTVGAQQHGGAVQSLADVPFAARVANALVAYVVYLVQTVWPFGLAVFYPNSAMSRPAWQPISAGLLLAAVTALALWSARRRPYLVVGWFWYLGTLVPVIGLVQVGEQAHADRYTYVPLIGVFIMMCWAVADMAATCHWQRWVVPTGAVAVLCGLASLTAVQVTCWHDSITLWRHTLQVAGPSAVAHQNLGLALLDEQPAEAARQFRAVLAINPLRKGARTNLALALLRQGNLQEALEQCRLALEVNGNDADAHEKAGLILFRQGNLAEAVDQLTAALRLDPMNDAAHTNLGAVLLQQGKPAEAAEHLHEARRLKPHEPQVHFNLGTALAQQGLMTAALECFRDAVRLSPREARFRWAVVTALAATRQEAEARREYREAMKLDPDWLTSAGRTAWSLATDPEPSRRNAAVARELAEEVCRAGGTGNPALLDLLAVTYAEAGRFGEAVALGRQALAVAEATGRIDLASPVRERVRLYEQGRPFRQQATKP